MVAAAGVVPGGPAMSEEVWRSKVREWFPDRYDTRLRQPSWENIAAHHETIEKLLGVVPASVIHQRLVDESGLEASVASLRRYLRAHFPEQVRSGEVVLWRPPVDPGDEAQVDYGYMGTWEDPKSGRRRRVWAFSMVLSYSRELFIYPVLCMDQRSWWRRTWRPSASIRDARPGWSPKMFRGTFSGLCRRTRYVASAVVASGMTAVKGRSAAISAT
jgi:hypothetical protein